MLKHLLALLTLAPTMALAGLRYQDDTAYYLQSSQDMYEAQMEAIYEAQIQQQFDAIAARQQQQFDAIAARQRYIEELLQQNDDQ
jgi:hypothetical protein